MIRSRFSFSLQSLCWVCLLGLTSFTLQAADPDKKLAVLDRMVASVNGDAITESELNRQTQLLLVRLKQTDTALPPLPVLRKQLLERIVLEKLQLQLATAEGLEVNDETVNQTVKEIADRDGLSVQQMQQLLEEQGIPAEQFRETIKTEMTLSKLQQKEVGQHIMISKAEVENFISSPAGQDQSDIEYRLGHILISLPEEGLSKEQSQSLKERAESIAKELREGANFSKTAIAKSAGQQALNGGDLGWRKVASIPTTFAKIVSTLQVGEIHGPIQDNSGFHIITLLNKRNAGSTPGKKMEETHLRQILINVNEKRSDKEAEAILIKLREQMVKGASFEKLAQKYSEEPNSATKDGDLGWVSSNRMVPKFNQQITTLKQSEISQPFKTDLGWHIIQILEKRTQHVSSAATRNKAMETLYQRKFDESLVSWLRHLRSDSEVEIYLNET